jgi:flagellar assembly protein FliH
MLPKSIRFSEPLRSVTLSRRPAAFSPEELEAHRRREEQAYERGLIDGERRLGEQLMQQRTELQHLHAGILASLGNAVSQVVRDTETSLIDLAFEIACKLVDDLPIKRELIEKSIQAALAKVSEATQISIHLHPEDLELLQKNTSETPPEPAGSRSIRFVADAEVGRGGSLVRTEFGVIDARRETRKKRAKKAVAAPK